MIVLITIRKGFAMPGALKSTPAAFDIARLNRSAAVMCALAMLGHACLPPFVTISCSKKHPLTIL